MVLVLKDGVTTLFPVKLKVGEVVKHDTSEEIEAKIGRRSHRRTKDEETEEIKERPGVVKVMIGVSKCRNGRTRGTESNEDGCTRK